MKKISAVLLLALLFALDGARAQAQAAGGPTNAAQAQARALPGVVPSTDQKAGTPPPSKAGGCVKCSAAAASPEPSAGPVTLRQIPGTSESVLVGRIENVIPIGILSVLGCEECSAKAVNWALQQGSSFEDVERALRTVAAMQQLACFKERFGPDVAARLDKPLAAAKAALEEARTRAAK